MSKVSLVEKHKSSKSLPISSLENRNLITIFAGGIVNPMGPTLSVLALDGKAVIGAHLPILHISLNPFSSFVKEIGVVKCGEEWINTESILPLLSNNFGSCPTLLLPSRIFSSEIEIKSLYAKFIESFDDASSTLKQIKKFPGDPMNRVQDEMDNIVGSVNIDDTEVRDSKIELSKALEFVDIQTNSENLKSELKAFLYAWNGSINFQTENGAETLTAFPSILSGEEFIEYLSIIAESCDLPI